jgi:hypothetical protein
MSASTNGRFAVAVLLGLVAATPAGAVTRRAFVTSVSGTGDLGSWPDAGSATGLAAGNAICRARAALAGLPNANTYRAWLSTDSTDAFCHVRGQSGEKSSACTGTALGAGPWYLVNGISHYTGSLNELAGSISQGPPPGKIIRPVLWDEFGNDLPEDIDLRRYWTGTDYTGRQFNNGNFHCSGWTSTSGSAAIGDGLGTANTWTQGGFAPACSSQQRLLCLEPGDSEPASLHWSPGNLVFITSISGTGNLSSWPQAGGASGLAAGDAICKSAAAAGGLPDPASFVAWLSTATTDARDRVTANGPFKRIDAYTVAGSEADLTDGSLDTSIHVYENGTYMLGTPEIATGTVADGTASGIDCVGWTSADPSDDHTGGRANFAGLPEWTEFSNSVGCNGSRHLYCISNRATLFWDGFEYTGTLSRWSGAAPP